MKEKLPHESSGRLAMLRDALQKFVESRRNKERANRWRRGHPNDYTREIAQKGGHVDSLHPDGVFPDKNKK